MGCHLRRGGGWDSEASLDVWRRAERDRRSGQMLTPGWREEEAGPEGDRGL